jgi:Fic family protein
VCENAILQALRDEKFAKMSGGIYHETQVRLTYNSNRIEGSKLSEDQTRLIFETNTIGSDVGVPVDDIIETANHFRAIDYVIECAEEPLTEDIIKNLHKLLKTGTRDSHISWFNVGEYKSKPNVVGGEQTTLPSKVSAEMKKLLAEYSKIDAASIRDIIKFHHDFEKIHPFQDGNGRVGRLIAFKECLRFNIIPFIIEDSKKMFYYRGLKEWNNEQGFLVETCLDGQDTYKALLKYFDIPFNE